jgi:hypothetical protein
VTAQIIGGITYGLADGQIRTRYGRSQFDGTRTAHLVLGAGNEELAIVVSQSSPETLALLEEAVAELRAEAERQARLAALPEVA